MRQTIHTTFQVVKARIELKLKCKECGKAIKRVVRVEHTINPFNKNSAGVPKSYSEVFADADREATKQADKMKRTGVMCGSCQDRAEDYSMERSRKC